MTSRPTKPPGWCNEARLGASPSLPRPTAAAVKSRPFANEHAKGLDDDSWYDFITRCQMKEVLVNPTVMVKKLIAVIGQIQVDSGLECPPLTGTTKPVNNVPEFDSKVWPVATTILSQEIGARIPDDVNIFIDEATKLPRSIDEIAVSVCEWLKRQAAKGATE